MDCSGELFHYIVAAAPDQHQSPAFEGTIAAFARFFRT
jgi:hypothetical protein